MCCARHAKSFSNCELPPNHGPTDRLEPLDKFSHSTIPERDNDAVEETVFTGGACRGQPARWLLCWSSFGLWRLRGRAIE